MRQNYYQVTVFAIILAIAFWGATPLFADDSHSLKEQQTKPDTPKAKNKPVPKIKTKENNSDNENSVNSNNQDANEVVTDNDETQAINDEDDCSALFGSEVIENQNEDRRTKILANVIESQGIVTVLHHAKHWKETIHAHGLGLDLISIEKEEDGKYHAFFDVTDNLAEYYGCESGIYEVSQDASLFSKAPVLWISRNFVLLEYEGQLTYITPDPDTRYIFRLVWQSTWTISRPKKQTSSRSRRRHSRRGRRR